MQERKSELDREGSEKQEKKKQEEIKGLQPLLRLKSNEKVLGTAHICGSRSDIRIFEVEPVLMIFRFIRCDCRTWRTSLKIKKLSGWLVFAEIVHVDS